MKFTGTEPEGAFVIDLEQRQDDRGYFARTFCANEFAAHGLKPVFVQTNLSFNYRKGTLRGMHYQVAPGHRSQAGPLREGRHLRRNH